MSTIAFSLEQFISFWIVVVMWHYWAIMEQGCGTTVLRIKKLKWSFVFFFSCQVMRHAGLLRKASHAHKEGVSFL